MGTSFVAYKDHGFWARDSALGSWLTTLLDHMQPVADRQDWLAPLIERWHIHKDIDGGVISVGLDEFLTDQAKRDFMIELAGRALRSAPLSARRTGELFIDLLAGRLKTTVSSPIDYLDESG